jgi:hypothetical protein
VSDFGDGSDGARRLHLANIAAEDQALASGGGALEAFGALAASTRGTWFPMVYKAAITRG